MADSKPIYTSEPMVTRALAAEIRHRPQEFTALLERAITLEPNSLGKLVSVECEADQRLDVLLTYQRGSESVKVGLEGKFDHGVIIDQLDREAKVVDHLVLICADLDAVSDRRGLVAAVLSWTQALAVFKGSRLTTTDIESIPLVKVRANKLLREVGLPALRLPAEWDAEIGPGGSGMPSIIIASPELPDGRCLRGQIQVTGRGMPRTLDETYFEYHVGVQVDHIEADFPQPDDAVEAPGWIGHLLILRDVLGGLDGRNLRLSKHSAGNSRSGVGANKMPLVRKFMPEKTSWLAKGYVDWALGIKSTKTAPDDLAELCGVAGQIFTTWYEAERAAAKRA